MRDGAREGRGRDENLGEFGSAGSQFIEPVL